MCNINEIFSYLHEFPKKDFEQGLLFWKYNKMLWLNRLILTNVSIVLSCFMTYNIVYEKIQTT
jgi:hypothetical protein